MLRKRVIFTLLFENDNFNLSRNFRLQKVGGLDWLKSNYNFARISHSIDELVVLDVSRTERNFNKFCDVVSAISTSCFIPISAGGNVNSVAKAKTLLRNGADKIVVNSALHEEGEMVNELATVFGQQCIVGSVDVKKNDSGSHEILIRNGTYTLQNSALEVLSRVSKLPIGELYLNSIDQDGTGQGLDLNILSLLPEDLQIPIILAGGVGNSRHLLEGLIDDRVDAVATANLFNFVGDGLEKAREELIKNGVPLPRWDLQYFQQIREANK